MMKEELVANVRAQLNAHKFTAKMSWSDLAKPTGIPAGTLSAWASNNYNAPGEKIAEKVSLYLGTLEKMADAAAEIPTSPAYFATPTGTKMKTLMNWAQAGMMTLIATGPGTGKTVSARSYREENPQTWLATMSPSSKGMMTMQKRVLRAMGETTPKGSPDDLTSQIVERLRGSKGLLVMDEIQFLNEEALEEVRSWYDETGTGICLMGNPDVLFKLMLGPKQSSYARLARRIRQRMLLNVPKQGDCDAFCDAWGVTDTRQRAFLSNDVMLKAGGLGTGDNLMKLALMVAQAEGAPLTLMHMRLAWRDLSSQQMPS
jgi:DNA transposition AAA+ family ATPase